MKTYKKTIVQELPQLQIFHDEYAESPRTFQDNLGYFITCEKRHNSPDDNEDMKSMIQNLGDESSSLEEHMAKIKEEFPINFNEKVIAIYPVNRFEHGNVNYTLGVKKGFDYSNSGFYIVTDKTQKVLGTPKKLFEKVIKQELEEYTAWCNGEVYRYELYDNQGNLLDSQGTFYSLEDIKWNLPKTWSDEDLSDYIQR